MEQQTNNNQPQDARHADVASVGHGAKRRYVAILAIGAFAALGFGFAYFLPTTVSKGPSDLTILNAASALRTANAAKPEMGDIQAHQAPSLTELLPGLEAKVAADPDDFDLRLLLAQTYLELNENDKAATHLKQLRTQAPDNPQITVLLGRALVDSSSPAELRRMLPGLEPVPSAHPELEVEARNVMGRMHARLGDKAAAREQWTRALNKLGPHDPRRGELEMELAHLSR